MTDTKRHINIIRAELVAAHDQGMIQREADLVGEFVDHGVELLSEYREAGFDALNTYRRGLDMTGKNLPLAIAEHVRDELDRRIASA